MISNKYSENVGVTKRNQNLVSSCPLCKNLKIIVYITSILPDVLYRSET